MKKVRNMVSLGLALVMLLALCAPALAQSAYVYAKSTTAVRQYAKGNSSRLGMLLEGEYVEKVGTSGVWTAVRYNTGIGYVLSSKVGVYTGHVEDGGQSVNDDIHNGDILYARFDTTVRNGPSVVNKKVLTLYEGDSASYLSTQGAWYQVKVGSKSGYVLASDVRLAEQSAQIAPDDLVFAKKNAYLFNKATSGRRAVGYMNAGDYGEFLGVSGSYTQVRVNGIAGYVASGVLEFVTGTGSYIMDDINAWRFSADRKVYGYSIPVEKTSFRKGYFSRDEAAFALSGNDYWTKVLVGTEAVFVPTDYLSKYSTTGQNPGGRTGVYTPGTIVNAKRRSGAETYASWNLDPYIPEGDTEPYGVVSAGTDMIVLSVYGELALVVFTDDRSASETGLRHRAYVALNEIV